jgi:Stress responsive A/B Barrel Domain
VLAHNVYFSLRERSDESRNLLIAGCKKYLDKHPGSVFFACGGLAQELNRPVNDRDFDVALHVVFENEVYQDQYQQASRHKQFIAECGPLWSRARVFDSVVD